MLDTVIRGGTIIDGTGSPGFSGDVGIRDGRIVAVGSDVGAGAETIDAHGALVTPGFVDIHTHYDGQVTWDGDLAPSSLHGVTTIVMGSCGVGFAPLRPGEQERLIDLMEGVEDIPGSALAEGVQWRWDSFEDYLDALGGLERSINFLAQIPHDPLRMYVMRERAIAGEDATEDDVAEMHRLVTAALRAGAVGFSTGRTDNHRTAGGLATPASEATRRELAGIASALRDVDHGVLQAVSDFKIGHGDEHFHAEFDLLEAMIEASGGRPLSLSCMQRDQSPKQWKWIFERAEKAADNGMTIRCQVAPRAIGVLLGLRATFHPFMGFPSYKKISHLPLPERVAAMRDPELKRQMLSEKSDPVAGDGSPIPPLADIFLSNLEMLSMRLFRLGSDPDYEPHVSTSFRAEAMSRNEPVLSTIYDALLEEEGQSLLYFPLFNYTEMNLDIVREMLTHPLALPGLSDGGAHVGTICDASFPTFLLSYWGRDRKEGRIPLERLIQMQTRDTAHYLGLRDRGVLAEGNVADINVIDYDRLRLTAPAMVEDLPAGGQRLVQGAEGYVATLVGGQRIRERGDFTGNRPGRLIRAGKRT